MKTIVNKILSNKKDAFFLLFAVLNASIVFNYEYFPTQDSGAHAYNSNILFELFFGSGYKDFFIVNPEFVPNLTAHIVMAFFNAFLPFNIAEKLTLFLYFMSFPFLFRALIYKFKKDNSWFIFLVFPFTHFCTLYWGFYNFAYGILFFLLGVTYWISHRNNFRIKNIIIYFFIVLICYFSHLVSFIAMAMFCGLYELMDLLLKFKSVPLKELFKEKARLFLKGLISFILPLVFTFLYFKKRPRLGYDTFLDTKELNRMLLDGDIFKSYGSAEDIYSRPLFYLIVVLFLYAMISKVNNYFVNEKKAQLFELADVFLIFSGIFVYLFYTQPDSDGYGGYISIRLALFANLLLIVWACITIKRDVNMETLSLIVVLFLNYRLIEGKKESLSWLNSHLQSFKGVTDHLKDGDLVAPVFIANYNWLGGHFSNYLGADKNVVVLENYEASSGYFPVLWKNPHSDVVLREPNSINDITEFKEKVMNYPYGKINYVLVYGKRNDSELCKILLEEIEKDFSIEWSNRDVFLYKRSVVLF